jgi:hypothetical protein
MERNLEMEKKAIFGGILSIIAALIGLIGHFVLFFKWYAIGMSAESAEPGCEILLKFLHPGLADLGLVAAALFAVAAYGFFSGREWAFRLSTIGIVFALLSTWFINVPFMAASLPPVYFSMFFPYLLIYFLLLRYSGNLPWKTILLALLTGMAYIFCFMNGVASTSRIITVGAPIFVLVVSLHWLASIAWAAVTVGTIVKAREWMRVLGLCAGAVELAVGIPLALATGVELGRFSLFALAPIFCLVLIIIFVWPNLFHNLTGSEASA